MTGDARVPLPPVCILAGGLATRLGDIASEVPKALVEVAGRPFVEHQLELLARHGADRVVFCTGHLGDKIREHVGTGERFGLRVDYSDDGDAPAGTLGAVRGALPLLAPEAFLVLYGDTYLRVDYTDVAARFAAGSRPALMTVLHNEGRWGPSNTEVDGDRVVAHDKRAPTAAMQWIDYGLSVLSARAVAAADPGASDLSELFAVLAQRRELAAYPVTERFYEIGTPERLEETARFLAGRQA